MRNWLFFLSPWSSLGLNLLLSKGVQTLQYHDTVKPLYFAPHLIDDFSELIKIVKFNEHENGRKYVKL